MIDQVIQKYLKGIEETLLPLDSKQTELLIEDILKAKRIFIFGAGRSGLVGKAFAMRLMHLGKKVFFIGETTTPAIEKNDALFFVSGSGNTLSVVNMIRATKTKKIKILGITSCKDGALFKEGDNVICIEGEICKRQVDYLTMQIMGLARKIAPLGSNFESSALVYLDSLIVLLMARTNKSEQDLKKRHANLE
jgi:6-phospho 3-hexuloisomerase